jgi:hypothetical protein
MPEEGLHLESVDASLAEVTPEPVALAMPSYAPADACSDPVLRSTSVQRTTSYGGPGAQYVGQGRGATVTTRITPWVSSAGAVKGALDARYTLRVALGSNQLVPDEETDAGPGEVSSNSKVFGGPNGPP